MRRTILIATGVALSLLLWWGLWPDDAPRSTAAPSVSQVQQPNKVTPSPSRALGARVSGFVFRDGKPVENSRVSLRAAAPLVTHTLEGGRFLFEDVPSGQVYLSAATREASSEVVGPLQLVPGGSTEGVLLTLMPSVKIEGRVIDLLSQKPVSGATVISPNEVGVTDNAGKFTLTGSKSQIWLDVSAPGFLSRSEWVSLEMAAAGGKLELVLTPSSRLEGTVTESGNPIAAATVWAEVSEGARRGERFLNVFTDKAGHFSLECAAGTLQLAAVTPSGIRIKGPLVRVAVGEKKSGLILDAGDVSSAEGILTVGGEPVSGAQISAIDAPTEDINGLASTGIDGKFRFDGLVLGKYVLQVRSGALTASVGPFEHRGDGQPWVVALKSGGILSGTVKPASAGVIVRWRSGTWSGPLAQTVTDEAGRFRFEGLPDELISLEAEGTAGSATARAKVGDEVVLALKKGFVTVHLQDDLNAPVTDGVLVARSLETGSTRRQLVLAPDGIARVDLPNGRWQLSLEASGRGRSANADVTVTEQGAEVWLSLESSVVITGKVIEKTSMLPIASVRVEVVSGQFGRGSRVSVLTDGRGEFLLPPVARSGTLVVSREGFVTQWRRVADGARWEVTLEPAGPKTPKGPEVNQFEGVGMTLDGRSGALMVTLVSEGSPAERAGVQAGDQILSVDGVAIAGQPVDAVVQRIRGPSGSAVVISFARGGQHFELTIRRRLLTL